MNWKILNQPLGVNSLGGGYAPRKKEIIPAIVMAAAAAGSAIHGGIASSKANKQAMEEARSQKLREDALLNRRRYENFLDTSAGQAMMTRAREFARENWKKAAGGQAVTGGTDAKAALAKEAGNKMVGDAIANIAVQDQARKDGVDAEQLASDRAYSQQAQAYEQQRGQAIAQAAQGASNALAQGAMVMASAPKSNLAGGSNGGTPTNNNPQTFVPVGNLKVGGMQWRDNPDKLKELFTGAARTSLF